uniref:OBP47-like domain-containing protein n=1 Tax=Anopheles farauti TaxID=69004 RepID=A0A9I3GJL4_9DIPT
MPRLLPQDVVRRCRQRPLPPVPDGVKLPVPANCQAECVLNVTRILMDHHFRVRQAVKVMVARVPNNTIAWKHLIETTVEKCYKMQVRNAFYLQDVAQNLISSQCIPSSIRFIECTFSIMYRDCPDAYWKHNDDRCRVFVTSLNNCQYLFHRLWDI